MRTPGFQVVDGVPRWHLGDQEPEGCRYVIGEPWEPGWRYCQRPQRPGRSFCEEHHSECYTAVKRPVKAPQTKD